MASLINDKVNRRRLVGTLGVLGASAATTAFVPAVTRQGPSAALAANGMSHGGTSSGGELHQDMTVDEMDSMHEAGVKSFPAPTAGKGGMPLEFVMDGDVKVFTLECKVVQWEVAPGQMVEAWTYNGVVPGPEVRVTEGEKVRFEVTNNLPESTAVHWHGLFVPNAMDGVPYITQPPIKPGESFTYEFQVREGNAGSHMYHSHHNSAFQTPHGLLGPFIVLEKDEAARVQSDVDYTMILNDGPIGGFSLNGKSFPATEPIVCKLGQKVRVRYMNEGAMIHPMHLHGMPQTVIAQDGWMLPQPYKCDTLNIAPGQRFDVMIDATELGVWAFHCHILSHAEGPTGMFGMVTALIVQE